MVSDSQYVFRSELSTSIAICDFMEIYCKSSKKNELLVLDFVIFPKCVIQYNWPQHAPAQT